MSRRAACPTARLFSLYLRNALSEVQQQQVTGHLALCASCRKIVSVATEAALLGVDSTDLRKRVADASAFVHTLEARESPHTMHRSISESSLGADPFVAGRLLERSREEFSREPIRSLLLARLALRVAERASVIDLQFEVFRDCASLYVRLGDFEHAWTALDMAEQLAPQTADPEHARGLLLYAKAYVASQPDVWRLDEAAAWTDEAAEIFARTDTARLRAAAEMRAFVHNLRGDHRSAVEITRRLWQEERGVGLALNFAAYLIDAGEPTQARELLEWARPRIAATDVVTLAKHADIYGLALSALGDWVEATAMFTRSRDAFRSAGMKDTAVRIELSRIRATVAAAGNLPSEIGRAVDDLRALAAASIDLDRKQPSRRRNLTAQACEYLRRVVETEGLNLESVTHVERYLAAITRGPVRPFVRRGPMSVM